MEQLTYKQKNTYDWKKRRNIRDDEKFKELKTVPGQAISIKELVDRYEKGRPIPGAEFEEL